MSNETKYIYGVFRLDGKLVVGEVSSKTAWGTNFASPPLSGYQNTAAEARGAYRLMCRRKFEAAKIVRDESDEGMEEVGEWKLPK